MCSEFMRFAAALLTLAVCASSASAAAINNSGCLDCHSDKTLTKKDANGKEIALFVDAKGFAASVHGTNACVSCHADVTPDHPDNGVALQPVNCAKCHERQSRSYGASVHGLAAAKGISRSAGCVDCHGSHSILPPTSPASPLYFARLAQTCGKCHPQAAKDVEESVHGEAVAEGHRDAPTCTDCHSEHKIVSLDHRSPLQIAAGICSSCHASARLNAKYNLPADRVRTFFESYHGLAVQYGSTVAANCASCHGWHLILPSSDPRSSINKANLVRTCGKCHPGASANFAETKVHVDLTAGTEGSGLGGQINWWVRRVYLALIFIVIGAMLIHNGMAFGKKLRARFRSADFSVMRMNLSQRLQHLVLALSFVVLALSGFALKFPESWIGRALGSNEMVRRWIHRVAGVVLLCTGAYHLGYLLGTRQGRQLLKDMLPVGKDIADVAANAKYLAGVSPARPRFARFGYPEKMEYWAVAWGTIIMGVTGLMIWFKLQVTRFLPGWVVDVATTIHYYEAVLACLAIVVWHFYHVIFDPDVYPLNWACCNGGVSKRWQEEEHPLDQTVQRAAASPPELAQSLGGMRSLPENRPGPVAKSPGSD
jgi:formate dehydrogenase gamma subunit